MVSIKLKIIHVVNIGQEELKKELQLTGLVKSDAKFKTKFNLCVFMGKKTVL